MSDKKKETLRAVKFVLFSISAGLIQAVSIWLLETFTRFPSWLCYLIGLVLSVLWNFTLNRKFTFKSAANVPLAMLKVAAYYAVYAPLSTLGVKFLTEKCLWPPILADGLAMALNLVTEFLYQRFFVFGKSLDTAVRKKKSDEESEI
ncbi:MAG: GtrA family protein [Oscillospiraceae bacterium]|nr:GtrA family protein [Oscillospiraceae bacterium]MBQ3952254.1 GtrA family protein [Oscillospiraceae bacterium]